jgi:hypothetical protein
LRLPLRSCRARDWQETSATPRGHLLGFNFRVPKSRRQVAGGASLVIGTIESVIRADIYTTTTTSEGERCALFVLTHEPSLTRRCSSSDAGSSSRHRERRRRLGFDGQIKPAAHRRAGAVDYFPSLLDRRPVTQKTTDSSCLLSWIRQLRLSLPPSARCPALHR